MGSSTTESGLAQGVQDLRLQPAGWYAVHSLHSARWLAVVPRWVLSSDSPLAALSPLAGSGTPLGTLKWSRPITDLRFSWWSQYQRHATDALQQGQLTALASAFLASMGHKAAHAAESARIAASLPQRFDPPLPARNYHPDCVEAKLGLRSVGEAMTLRGTLARATFRPPRFPQQDPLPKQTEAMRQSKAEAMRQSKARAMRKSKEVQPTCKYATWTRRNQLRLTLA